MAKSTFADMPGRAGEELGVSEWITVDQAMIDQFADTTRDRQWIHIDVERARSESPYGATVAHGYLTLSLLAVMSYDIGAAPEGTVAAFNYGLDKVRFLSPVRAGARVRMRSKLKSFEKKSNGQYLMKNYNVVEIEGEERPALVADTLVLLVAGPDAE
ncbi:MaoC family dehydratase [Nitratireductor mangrovi]|uniref:MaoC family dehydratase n=1 Tax=Nitratireductor mangrovi TaxID=2599600 RepID=A0A5B8L2N8_9HYPH|nr:MaoC family dehydratase [Nitratireductor mangrovi]QDZ02231.1 MaoC family dehydratase [Nitratireductor mangrovi]